MPRKKHVAVDFCYHLLVGLDMGGEAVGRRSWFGQRLDLRQTIRKVAKDPMLMIAMMEVEFQKNES